MIEGDRSVGYHPLQKDTSRKASSSSVYTPLHSGREGSFRGMGESDHSVESDPFQSDISQNALSIGNRPLHSENVASLGCTGLCDYSVGSDPLQSGAFRKPSSGVYPSFNGNTPCGFQDLAAAESSKQTLQKGNT